MLIVTHGCWEGNYSDFMRWRVAVCEAAGWGELFDYRGYQRSSSRVHLPWPADSSEDPLPLLLGASDSGGVIPWRDCDRLADRLEGLKDAIAIAISDEDKDLLGWRADTFVRGLRAAAASGINVELN